MNLKKLISNKSHWTVNKHLAKEIGLETTLILQHLIDWSDYHNKNEIFQTYEQIQNELGISAHSVKRVGIPKLKELGFISVSRKGVGFKNHYTIHTNVILDFLTRPTSEVNTTGLEEGSTDSPTSEVKFTSLKGENNLSSEDENDLAINKNILNQEYNSEKSIYEETIASGAGWNKDFVENKILDVLMDYDIHPEDKRFINAIEDYKEAGRFDGISSIMEWDDSQKKNWWRVFGRIENLHLNK